MHREQAWGPFQDSEGRPLLRDSWTYYLDALGTKEAATLVTQPVLRERLKHEAWYHRFIHHGNLRSRQAVLYFSDNVVVAAPVGERADESFGVLAQMLIGVADYIVGMAVDAGVAYRGAVTFGPAFVAHKLFPHDPLALVGAAHGKAIVEAAALERVARYPRVLIADAVVKMLESHFEAHPLPIFAASLARDNEDGSVFLDHLDIATTFDPVMTFPYPRRVSRNSLLEMYRRFIESGIQNADDRVAGKYRWLGRYFNATLAARCNLDVLEIPGLGRLDVDRLRMR